MAGTFRLETDSLGDVRVPADALWGAHTQRAVANFPVSGLRLPPRLIRALGLIKKIAAEVSRDVGLLDPRLADAIATAAAEVAAGKHDDQFPVDVFQTGSGTSSNMNANEVIANRAIALLGGQIGTKTPVHPNDHVNRAQSSNDVIPTAVHLAAADGIDADLLPALRQLYAALTEKAAQLDAVVKIGRTHLMDAVPIRLGQEFSGYAAQVAAAIRRLEAARGVLSDLALGGTAVGTGLGAEPGFALKVIAKLAAETGLPLRQAPNLFEALAARDALVDASGALRSTAVSLTKIANDVRWLASGPRCGIGEIQIPDLQPGSSIMPGKVNPVMPEMLLMVCAQVIGNDTTVAWSGAAGNFELNAMIPVIAFNVLQSIDILSRSCQLFADRCVRGITAHTERCETLVEQSLALVTALTPRLGYDTAAAIARESLVSGKTIRELLHEKKLLPSQEIDRLLDARTMTGV